MFILFATTRTTPCLAINDKTSQAKDTTTLSSSLRIETNCCKPTLWRNSKLFSHFVLKNNAMQSSEEQNDLTASF
jgi:hypothetical protein